MAYSKQTWVDNQTPISATRMNNIESGIAAAGTQVCTSTTRPSAPYTGMEIFETDTSRKLIYTGSNWYKLSGPTVYNISSVVGVTAPNGSTTTIVSYNWTNSDYIGPAQITFTGMAMATTNAAQYVFIYIDSTLVGNFRYHNEGSGYNVYDFISVTGIGDLTTTGTHTITAKANVDSGGASFTWAQSQLSVYS